MRSMRTIRATGGARSLAVAAAGLAVALAVPVALAAGSEPLEQLRAQRTALDAAADTATLELYALEARLARARAEAEALAARRGELARQRAATHRRALIAGRAEQAAQERLAELLRELYAQGSAEPLAVLLAAGSLDEALSRLESLDRAAADSARVAERAGATRRRLVRLETTLAAQEAELATVAARARATVLELEAGAAARAAYVSRLRDRAALTERRLTAMRAQAEAAARRTATLQSAPALQVQVHTPLATAAPVAAEAAPGPRTMRVDAVGYSLPGVTATGLRVGHGVVAVDPAVIPLGTRLHVPGYGDAVAADTGSAIRGALIDLWFPTEAQARAWGRRSVVVTFR